MKEEWRDIPDHLGYQASNFGRIRSVGRYVCYSAALATSRHGPRRAYRMWRQGRVLKQAPHAGKQNNSGHLMTMLGRHCNMDAHVAVALAFHGRRPFPKAEVLHLDHDETNNRSSNLRWGTRSENLKMDYARGVLRGFQL